MNDTDPWQNKYMINVRELNANHISAAHNGQSQAVIVISAGSNRKLETNSEQPGDSYVTVGDDLSARIK